MADSVSSVKHIVQLALQIKDAVETVRKNKEQCVEIRRRVVRVSGILSQLQDTEILSNNPAMMEALEELDETLRRAHTLITACQEKNVVCLFCTATTLSRKLHQVKDDILHQMTEGMFAITIHVTIVLAQIQDNDTTPPRRAGGWNWSQPRLRRRRPLPRRSGSAAWSAGEEGGGSDGAAEACVGRPAGGLHSFQPFSDQYEEIFYSAEYSGYKVTSAPLSGLIEFSLTELEVATHHFSTTIGNGGFATIYKGVLSDGLEVAVRKLANGLPSPYDNMTLEHPLIRLHSMLEHKNVVKLLGYCHESKGVVDTPNEDAPNGTVHAKEELLLMVEEYMKNGNLSNFIYADQLDWSSRFRIIQGITHGVIYLHTHPDKPIVYLDLKPDNILLDSDMNPKIGDFGLAEILEAGKIDESVRGTLGYMPPEYIVEGVISVKNDVYGFGVTLLETISGMSESGRAARHQASIEWAWKVRHARATKELFDPSLCDESQLKEVKRCMEIGLLCTQNKPTDRPTMPDVLEMLEGKKKMPTPKQPAYIKRVRAVGRKMHV